MATQVQFRGGTTTEHASFNGAAREVTVDTTKQTLVVQDGSTNGGFPLLGEKNADNIKVYFGTDNDLECYHSGSHAFLKNSTGNLQLMSDEFRVKSNTGNEAIIQASLNGSVELYWDGSKKFETTSDGTATTGEATITSAGYAGKPTLTLGANNNSSSTSLTNSTSKGARVGVYHYTNAEEPAAIFYAVGSDTSNQVNYGGGTTYMNAATHHKFFTADDITTTGGTERLRIDGNGRVSINTQTPHCGNFGVHIKTGDSGVTSASTNRDDIFIEGVDHTGITISTPNNKTGAIGFDDPDGAGRGRLQYSHSSEKMQLYTSGTNSFEFTDDLNILDGNLVVAGNHGIMFNPHDATDSSNTSTGTYGSDSNLLSDYEEGSANITVYFGANDGSDITYTSNNEQRGWYTKIGRFVHVNGTIGLANKGSGTGGFYFKGLPFVTSNKTGARLGGVITYAAHFSGVDSPMHLYSVQNTSSKVYVYYYDSDGDSHVVSNSHIANNTALRFSLTYMVD